MVIDHINGVANDNRLENLRMLCPHCNSQQDTFAGRNCKWNKPKKNFCLDCEKEVYRGSKRCRVCANRINAQKRIKFKR